MLAAVGFAGLLVLILKSDEVRSMLLDIVRNACRLRVTRGCSRGFGKPATGFNSRGKGIPESQARKEE